MSTRTLTPLIALLFLLLGACTSAPHYYTTHYPVLPQPDAQCGGIANVQCTDDAYCDIASPDEGDDLSGTCQPRPTSCPDIAQDPMACGRDGQRYATECHANMQGVDVITGPSAEHVCDPS